MYKLKITPPSTEVNTIIDLNKNCSFSNSVENTDYQQFIQDVAEQGIDIVEGPDVVEPSYSELRATEYPSREDQFDMQYHDQVDETTTWKDTIQSIKDKYPKTITGGTTIGDVPDWVQTAADNWTFNKQLREYVAAVERLSQYILSESRPELTEDVIIKDEEERAAAQLVLDNTPQSVIDSLS